MLHDAEQTRQVLNDLQLGITSTANHRRLSHSFLPSQHITQARFNSRTYATRSAKSNPPPPSGSIFAKSESAWDHVFSDIQDIPALLPTGGRDRISVADAKGPSSRSRRQAMTAREISAFDEMFNMIFTAVSGQKTIDAPAADNIGIGRAPNGSGTVDEMSQLFSKMKGHSRKQRWTTESDEELDRKKEEMELCETDQQLLVWAMREVFGESKRYYDAALQAMKDADKGGEAKELPSLQPETYPRLLALLIRQFRDKYRDPHLALSMFDHARHLSVASYVFGCTTPAYNELIETRWRCFRDLKGVHDALEEMTVNGVDPDNRTGLLIEEVRREVGERNKWEEESKLGSGEVWVMMNKIEALIIGRPGAKKRTARAPKSKPSDEAWKKEALVGNEEDGWEFDSWEREKKPKRWERPAEKEELKPNEYVRDLGF